MYLTSIVPVVTSSSIPHFQNPQDVSFNMDLAWIFVSFNIMIRPILKFDALPIAHFEAYVPNFSKHLWKLAISSKIWVSDPPQSRLIRICVPQKSCFLTTFLEKIIVLTHFDPIYPPPMIYIVGKLWISVI